MSLAKTTSISQSKLLQIILNVVQLLHGINMVKKMIKPKLFNQVFILWPIMELYQF